MTPIPTSCSVRDRSRTRTHAARQSRRSRTFCGSTPTVGQVYTGDDDGEARIPVLVAGMTGDERERGGARRGRQAPAVPVVWHPRRDPRSSDLESPLSPRSGITQMFGSDHVADDERKLLAFTDSVQDASHRAAFFSGRTHRFNLRATLSGALQTKGRVPLHRGRRGRSHQRRPE